MQAIDRVAPVIPVDEIIPVGDQVPERTTVVAEGNAAVHAPAGLRLHFVRGEVVVDLLPVEQPHRHIAPRRHLPPPLEKACCFTHSMASSTSASLSSRSACGSSLALPSPRSLGWRSSSRCFHHSVEGLLLVETIGLGLLHHVEDPRVVDGHHLLEVFDLPVPIVQNKCGDSGVRVITMCSHHPMHE